MIDKISNSHINTAVFQNFKKHSDISANSKNFSTQNNFYKINAVQSRVLAHIAFGSTERISLKEIQEQPIVLDNLANNDFPPKIQENGVDLSKLTPKFLKNIEHVFLVGTGSADHAGRLAQHYFEDLAGVNVTSMDSKLFTERNVHLNPEKHLVIVTSQSGKTPDALEALQKAKELGVHTLAVTNSPESEIHKSAESKLYVKSGNEKAIAATKSLTAQVFRLIQMANYIGEIKGNLSKQKADSVKKELKQIAPNMRQMLSNDTQINKSVDLIKKNITDPKTNNILHRSIFVLGPEGIGPEGALKIREVTDLHAEGELLERFQHGAKASANEHTPIISILTGQPNNEAYKSALANTVQLQKQIGAPMIIIKNKDDDLTNAFDKENKNIAFVDVPNSSPLTAGFYSLLALQRIAYGLNKELNIAPSKLLGKVEINPASTKQKKI